MKWFLIGGLCCLSILVKLYKAKKKGKQKGKLSQRLHTALKYNQLRN